MPSFNTLLKYCLLPGLAILAVLTLLASQLRSGPVEADLRARTLEQLQARHGWASISASGRDLRISGLAPDEAAVASAVELSRSVKGVRVVEPAAELPAIADPFAASVTYDGRKVTLTGNVANDEMRAGILDAVKGALPEVEVNDALEWARGAPQGFAPLMAYGIAQLGGLKSGEISVSGTTLSVGGEASTPDTYAVLQSALAGPLPGGGETGSIDIEPARVSPYLLSVEKSAQGLTVSGHTPGEANRDKLLDDARQAAGSGAVTSRLIIAQGQPDGFDAMTGFVLEQVGRMSSASALIEDNKISLRGTAGSVADYAAITGALQGGVPKGAQLLEGRVTPASVSPYRWSVEISADGVAIGGFAPDDAARAQIAEAVNLAVSGMKVDNRMDLAAGVPDGIDWLEATAFLASQLPKFRTAKLEVSDGEVAVSGMAATPRDYDGLNALFGKTLPHGLKTASVEITRPLIEPFTWSFSLSQENGAALGGFVPDPRIAVMNIDKARALLPDGANVSDSQQIAAGAPKNFVQAIDAALLGLARLRNGSVKLEGTNVVVEGKAPTGVAANEIKAQLVSTMPDGFTPKLLISIDNGEQQLQSPDCQKALDEELSRRKIRFESGSATLTADSRGVLDALAGIVRRCPQSRVEIAGHTDADGSDVANQKLSEARANTVLDYLVRSGVFASRLVANGYGETEPLEDNSTGEGRARNRRIEFRVIQ